VMLRFSDNTTVHGDVLVGADGAHSGVRQHLYKTLQAQGLLPKADTRNMHKGYISFVGTTIPLDPAKYPGLARPDSVNSYHIGDSSMPYSVRFACYFYKRTSKGISCHAFKLTTNAYALYGVTITIVGNVYGAWKQNLLECCHSSQAGRY
jgi:hypothetical protein